MMGKKFTLEYVKKYFKDNNCILLEEKYVNANKKMKYICECGNKSEIRFAVFKNGHRCNKCGSKKMAAKRRFTLEYVKKYFKDRGCELLEERYIDNKTRMKYRCNCGNISKIVFNCFKQNQRCKICGSKKSAEKQKYKYEEVKNIFSLNGCELLSMSYKDSKTLLYYICSCGNKSKISFHSFLQGHRCKKCGYEKNAEKLRYNYKEVKEIMKEKGCRLLSKDYKNGESLLYYICSCGNKSKISFHSFLQGHRCRKCAIEKNLIGKNNHRYNPNLTDEDRMDRRLIHGYNEWVKNVYKKDNYICQKCKTKKNNNDKYKKLNAHHIEGYAENKALRIDINNGVCWCYECHRKFHKIYGHKNNNKKQYNEFIKIGVI
jgi:hypothetical protein